MSESPDTSEGSPSGGSTRSGFPNPPQPHRPPRPQAELRSGATDMADAGVGESNALKRRPSRLTATDGLRARLTLVSAVA